MAINYRAGLEELARGSEAVKSNFQNIQAIQAQGNAQVFAARQQEFQNKMQVQESKNKNWQQTMDAVKDGANMFIKAQQMRRDNERHDMEMEAGQRQKKLADMELNAKKSRAAAINEQYQDIKLPDELMFADEEEQAEYRNAIVTARNTEEAKALNKSQTEASITHMKTQDETAKAGVTQAAATLDFQKDEALKNRDRQKKLDAMAADKEKADQVEKVAAVVKEGKAAQAAITAPMSVYTRNVPDDVVKERKKTFDEFKSKTDGLYDANVNMKELGKMLLGNDVVIQDGKFSPQQLKEMAGKIKSMPSDSPELFKIKAMVALIKNQGFRDILGPGQVTENERQILGQARGTDFINSISLFSPERQGFIKQAIDKAWKDEFREGQFVAFGEMQAQSRDNSLNKSLKDLVSSDGFSVVDKQSRSMALYNALPISRQDAMEKSGKMQEWLNAPITEQVKDVYGDKANGLDFGAAATNDAYYNAAKNGSVDAFLNTTKAQLKVFATSGTDVQKKAAINALQEMDRESTMRTVATPAVNGVVSDGTKTPLIPSPSGDGMHAALSVSNGVGLYSDPNQNMSRMQPNQNWLNLKLDPAKSPQSQVKLGSFK